MAGTFRTNAGNTEKSECHEGEDFKEKIMKVFLLSLVLSSSFLGYGQRIFSEGTIIYAVSSTVDDKSMNADVKSIQQVKGAHTRVELNSAVGRTVTIFNSRDEEGAILQEFGSQKIMIPVTKENLSLRNKKFENIVYEYTGDAKKILDYNCLKATSTLIDGTRIEVYFSKDLLTDNTDIGFQFGSLPGLALEFTSTIGNRSVKYSAVSIKFEPVPIQNFDIPTSGYRILSYEESQKKK